jgi:hypothetical protein
MVGIKGFRNWFTCHSTGCFERESEKKEFKKGKKGKTVATATNLPCSVIIYI